MKPDPANLFRLLLTAAICFTIADSVMAQRQRRGSELDLLRSENVLLEIGVSPGVIDQIDRLRRDNTTTRAAFEKFKEDLRAAETDEQRSAIRQQIQDAVKQGGKQFQQQALELLNEEQIRQLRRVYIENYGLFALADDRVAADLDLSEEQRNQIKSLLDSRRELQSDQDLPEDERDTTLQKSEEQLMAVLSAEQRQTWQAQTAAPAAEEAVVTTPEAEPDPPEASAATASSEMIEDGDMVASFATRTASPDQRTERFSFNFRHVPWERVLQMFADATELTLDMQRVPPGTLSHLDQREYSAAQALDIINGYLIRKGFGLVAKDGFLVVVNLDEQLDQSLVPEVSLEELRRTGEQRTVGDHQLVTVRISVEGLDTSRTAQEVEALLGPWGSMIALTQSRVLMVTDIGANLRRIVGLLDSAARPDELVFTAYHLKHIDVEEAEPLLLTQFGMRLAAKNVSAAAEGRRYRESRSRDSRSSEPAAATPATSEDQLQVASDLRTNSLLVTGTPAQHQLVQTILKAIDVSESPDGTVLTRTGRRGRYLRVYDVSSADAREVTKTLDAIMPGIVVNEDGQNGKIHIMASEREHEEVEQLIRQLDGAGGRQSVAVIPLIKMDPLMAAATLRSLFVSEGTDAPTLETDLYGRRLIVRGSPEQVTQIKAVLAQLGEDGTGVRPTGRNGLRRRYSLQGRSPEEFLSILKDAWEDSEPNPIRIIVPSRSGPVREQRTSDGPVDATEPAAEQPETQTSVEPTPAPGIPDNQAGLRDTYFTIHRQDQPTDSQPPADDVVITVLGDDLLLTSSDPEALDRLEDLLDSLQQTIPYRTRWTVFYLQSADATEAADMLSQIFPSSSVASTAASAGGSLLGSLAGSFSGIGNSLADATGLSGLGESPQTLRIIPDVRSNSLLISGPEAVLQDVWAMLRVLDSNEIPESFRDMQQRTIELNYADIDNVAAILREVYKPLMEARDAGKQQPQNPFAAMLGASSNQKEANTVRMTLGVDRQTSSLVISSSQEIFDDVRELVETLDKKAMSANRTIRVVRLRSADPAMVQNSLSGLFSRITTTAAGSRPGGGGESANSQEGVEKQQRENEERQQAEAIRRWRERTERARQSDSSGEQGGGRRNGRRNRLRER